MASRAVELARGGFEISPRLADSIKASDRIPDDPTAKAYFFNGDGTPKSAGTLLRNEDYAQSVMALVDHGNADAFYSGPMRDDIIAAVKREPRPGDLAAEDFDAYRVKEREPVCGKYRGYKVCGMGPPSSGGIAVAQILAMLEPFDMAAAGPNTAQSVHLYTQANRLAFADRNRYVADTDFIDVPVKGLLDPGYLAARSRLINPDIDMGVAEAGDPPFKTGQFFDGVHHDLPATSHMSIVDKSGNAVSMTTTIESAFGSGRMVRGYLLNNELTDFSFSAGTPEQPVANRVEPGKRPRSSMAPTIIFDQDNKLKYVLGSPGGSAIISYRRPERRGPDRLGPRPAAGGGTAAFPEQQRQTARDPAGSRHIGDRSGIASLSGAAMPWRRSNSPAASASSPSAIKNFWVARISAGKVWPPAGKLE